MDYRRLDMYQISCSYRKCNSVKRFHAPDCLMVTLKVGAPPGDFERNYLKHQLIQARVQCLSLNHSNESVKSILSFGKGCITSCVKQKKQN